MRACVRACVRASGQEGGREGGRESTHIEPEVEAEPIAVFPQAAHIRQHTSAYVSIRKNKRDSRLPTNCTQLLRCQKICTFVKVKHVKFSSKASKPADEHVGEKLAGTNDVETVHTSV